MISAPIPLWLRALFFIFSFFILSRGMVNLAPIKYSNVLSQDGGPIERLEYAEGTLLGMPCTHATAYLQPDFVAPELRLHSVVEQPDGAGSHRFTQVACHMAISEALERWAVYHCRESGNEAMAGMEFDHSSNGFAAFPGLFKRQARKAAVRESIERHCLMCWWEGQLGHHILPDPSRNVLALQVENPFSSHSVVVLWSRHSNLHSYAFGAGDSLNQAVWRALVELERIEAMLDSLCKSKHTKPPLEGEIRGLFERRIVYFSTADGMSRFLDRLERPAHGGYKPLKLLFDAAVAGPWDQYASVWRTIIEPPSRDYLSDAEDYFFWCVL